MQWRPPNRGTAHWAASPNPAALWRQTWRHSVSYPVRTSGDLWFSSAPRCLSLTVLRWSGTRFCLLGGSLSNFDTSRGNSVGLPSLQRLKFFNFLELCARSPHAYLNGKRHLNQGVILISTATTIRLCLEKIFKFSRALMNTGGKLKSIKKIIQNLKSAIKKLASFSLFLSLFFL